MVLLLGAGLLPLLFGVLAPLFVDAKPSAWLFYLNMRYWSVYPAIALWIVFLWVISETTDIIEEFLPLIRIFTIVTVPLVIFFSVWNSSGRVNLNPHGHPLWAYLVLAVAICCLIRSLFLLYHYWYEGEESIDFEEAQWFWGWSVFFLVIVSILEVMHFIPDKEAALAGLSSISLLTSYYDGLQGLIRHGQGAWYLQVLALLVFIVAIAFLYVVGKWMLIFTSRMNWGRIITGEDTSEPINITHFLPFIKIIAAIGVPLAVIFVLWHFFSGINLSIPEHPLWAYIVLAVVICCVIRSLYLLYRYHYLYEGEEAIDLEEAQWFWAWSGIFVVAVCIVEVMYIIPDKEATLAGLPSTSLLMSYYIKLQDMIWYGRGSGFMGALAILILAIAIAFVYVAGRWMLIYVSRKIWEE